MAALSYTKCSFNVRIYQKKKKKKKKKKKMEWINKVISFSDNAKWEVATKFTISFD